MVTGFAAGRLPREVAKLYVESVKAIVSASLVVGFAVGIIAILTELIIPGFLLLISTVTMMLNGF